MAESTNTFQKQFVRRALKYLPHHFALYISSKMHARPFIRALDMWARRHIVGKVVLSDFTSDERQHYISTVHKTTLWHGTGRLQYSNGKVVDVLQNILATGAIRPTQDAYAIFSGGKIMHSISLTGLRIIARCYADTHGKGYREPNRYGDALTWTSYHYGLFYARLYTLHYRRVKQYYKAWHRLTHDQNGHNTWGKKSNQSAQDVWDIFGLGSDIPGNYPIIFGIKEIKDSTPLSSVFRDYEVRTEKDIDVHCITHLEVPLSDIKQTEELLAKYSVKLPVLPIELGERIASQMPFSKLLGLSNG